MIMSSLFIIGNGFDLDHGIKTSYEDFHQFLKAEYPDASEDDYVLPESTSMPDGGIEFDDDEVASFLLRLISNTELDGDEWSDLENSLGVLDFSEYLDYVTKVFDKDGDIDEWKTMYNTEDVALNLVVPTQRITKFFSNWVDTIEIDGTIPNKPDFEALIDKNCDMFLTFNYTQTLEKLYQVKNVCHIHGEQGEDLLFGHGNDTDYSEEIMGKHVGAEGALQEIQAALRKDTTGAINNHQDFFDTLSPSVEKIYSYGFSFSKVDEVYIKDICYKLETSNTIWYLNDYDNPTKLKQYEEKIINCGFKGRFSTYHIRKLGCIL